MIRIDLAAFASVTVFALAPLTLHAQVPRSPIQPKIVYVPDLVATIDNSTRIVFARQFMIIDGSGTTASRAVVPNTECTGLTAGQRRNVDVRPLRWGVENRPNPTGAAAGTFVVTLKYKTVNNGLVGERVVNETVDGLALGTQRLFDFTDPNRVTQYSVSFFTEPTRTPNQNPPTGPGVKMNQEPVRYRTFCVPSVDVVDNAMVITADALARLADFNRANNILSLP